MIFSLVSVCMCIHTSLEIYNLFNLVYMHLVDEIVVTLE